jgi:hypothetical protein
MLAARFQNTELSLSLWFEDDGRVAYAYLKRGDAIIADVWVYNRVAPPTHPEWKDIKNAPFLNPRDYVADSTPFALPTSDQDISVRWLSAPGEPAGAELCIADFMAASLRDGDKPGFAAAAAQDGPLARTLPR